VSFSRVAIAIVRVLANAAYTFSPKEKQLKESSTFINAIEIVSVISSVHILLLIS
jgi:hypothetical protein